MSLNDLPWLKDVSWMSDPSSARLAMWVGGWLAGLLVAFLLIKSVNYRMTERHLVITLAGIPVRRIRIRDIRHMDTEPRGFAERWYNTLAPSRSRLVIHRRKGWPCRTLIITPKNPFGMMHELQKAKEKLKAAEASAGR
ncbi:MAG: hypothetical protein HYR88_14625 [Verrucomicrobia bacterium]|nr:hypothetical protein [Verrucomicrobiota bacterium]MBI3867922.1 hypothetical protein [Verrucomicrobiota bacterium]